MQKLHLNLALRLLGQAFSTTFTYLMGLFSTTQDYSNMSLDELLAEEAKMKSQKLPAALFMGLLVGIAVYAATSGKFLLTISLLFASGLIGYRTSENMKNIQAEISRRR